MKVKLLKKARNSIKMLNFHGLVASSEDKLVTIKRFDPDGSVHDLISPNNKPLYTSYNKALVIYKAHVLDVAKKLNEKSLLWHILHN